MFMFGLVTVCQGLVQSYSALLATRFFLGVFESGMFPGCFYLIGMWYRRNEVRRLSSLGCTFTDLRHLLGAEEVLLFLLIDNARRRFWRLTGRCHWQNGRHARLRWLGESEVH